MAAMMIGVDPRKGSHTAVVISGTGERLGELRVRACAGQAERLLRWAAAWPERTWAVEGAGGTGHLLARQLLALGERVLDVQPKLGARVRLLAAGDVNKNDPDDARSVAVAALRSPSVREARPDDHAAVLKVWSRRHRDLGRTRTQLVCRLHCVLRAGSRRRPEQDHRRPGRAAPWIDHGAGCVAAARCELAAAFLDDLRRIDAQRRGTRQRLAVAVRASGASLTGLLGAGPVVEAAIIGDVRDVSRFAGRDNFAACNGTAPIEVSSRQRKVHRLSRRGNRRINHAIHMAAVTQVSHRTSEGRAYYDKKPAGGKTPKEALRALKRQVSDAVFTRLQADARRAAARVKDPGGQQGNDSAASAAGLHPRDRLFGQATPEPCHHPTTTAASPVPRTARQPRGAPGTPGHSPVAASAPPAKRQVQAERPQRSEDERPAGAARRRPHSAARKASGHAS
jgi:transposase